MQFAHVWEFFGGFWESCRTTKTPPIRETLPLEEVKSCGVETCQTQFCGQHTAGDTFVVRLKSGIALPIFAVDFPGQNAEQFAAQLRELVVAAEQSPSNLPASWADYRRKISGHGMTGLEHMGPAPGTTGDKSQQRKKEAKAAAEMAMQQYLTEHGSGDNAGLLGAPACSNEVKTSEPVAEDQEFAAKLKKLVDLKAQGALTEDEFNAAKKAEIAKHEEAETKPEAKVAVAGTQPGAKVAA